MKCQKKKKITTSRAHLQTQRYSIYNKSINKWSEKLEPENIWQLYLQFTEMTNQFEKSSIALIQTGRELPERVHTAKYNVCLTILTEMELIVWWIVSALIDIFLMFKDTLH